MAVASGASLEQARELATRSGAFPPRTKFTTPAMDLIDDRISELRAEIAARQQLIDALEAERELITPVEAA